MHEVRVESLEGLERTEGELRLSANGGSLRIVFPHALWESLLGDAQLEEEPGPEELEELEEIRHRLESHARGHAFEEMRRAAAYGGFEYDLVLRPAGLYALTTGYHFAPVVGEELVARIGSSLLRDAPVEQAYAIGAVASEAALRAGDENLKVLSVRSRRCTASRFEMAPELWQVLSEGLGWRDVETFVNGRNA
jgi:hypothetical protein